MKVFEDFETQTEVLSDSYPIVEIFEGCGYEVQSTEVVIGGEKINVGCGNAFGGQEEEEVPEDLEKANNILNSFGYEETTFTKGLYGTYIKDYMKRVLEYLTKSKPNRVEAFKKGAKDMATWIIKNYDDFTLYYILNSAIATRTVRETATSSSPTSRRAKPNPPSSTGPMLLKPSKYDQFVSIIFPIFPSKLSISSNHSHYLLHSIIKLIL